MKIVVTTPTGNIGSRVTQLLIQAGVRPTLLVRDASRLAPEVQSGSDVREGDLSDLPFVLQATEGADALFWLIPANYRSNDPLGDTARLGAHAAEAIRTHQIARTVFLSSAGADRKGNDPVGALGKVEEVLNATGANLVHLRPGYFFTNLLGSIHELRQGVFSTTVPLDLPTPWNDPSDVGDIAAVRLLSRDWSGQIVQPIRGPRDLTHAEVASIVGAVAGREIKAVRISDDESRQGMLAAGLSETMAEVMVELQRGITESLSRYDGGASASVTPTPLEGWAYASLRPAL